MLHQISDAQGLMAMTHQDDKEQRYQRGRKMLHTLHGQHGLDIVDGLGAFAPDFARMIYEFPFADIYDRPALDLRSRQIATISALAAMGNALPQLDAHIAAGLHIGLTRQEIIEIIMQIAVYAGFPAAMNGLAAARAVFARLDEEAPKV
ncbi:4-carboxymuconolactone decarboxylase [Granulibacter bethesdensis]|uniref:4-carboxymuconolactone decarboxylase n=2 Tax=Granulibacter bethesdensis TaxID=364410 RepID=A0AAN0RDF9_9PROT|nr:4-carboxymuconolactone decarboxylase [Granulibacter bethesdensis]